jgi:hypothetical protein
MTSSKPFTLIAAVIFALMAVIHVIRLVTHFQVIVGSHVLPGWISLLGVLVPAALAWGLFREARR